MLTGLSLPPIMLPGLWPMTVVAALGTELLMLLCLLLGPSVLLLLPVLKLLVLVVVAAGMPTEEVLTEEQRIAMCSNAASQPARLSSLTSRLYSERPSGQLGCSVAVVVATITCCCSCCTSICRFCCCCCRCWCGCAFLLLCWPGRVRSRLKRLPPSAAPKAEPNW